MQSKRSNEQGECIMLNKKLNINVVIQDHDNNITVAPLTVEYTNAIHAFFMNPDEIDTHEKSVASATAYGVLNGVPFAVPVKDPWITLDLSPLFSNTNQTVQVSVMADDSEQEEICQAVINNITHKLTILSGVGGRQAKDMSLILALGQTTIMLDIEEDDNGDLVVQDKDHWLALFLRGKISYNPKYELSSHGDELYVYSKSNPDRLAPVLADNDDWEAMYREDHISNLCELLQGNPNEFSNILSDLKEAEDNNDPIIWVSKGSNDTIFPSVEGKRHDEVCYEVFSESKGEEI